MKKRIRVALQRPDNYLRCGDCLDEASIPFDLNQQGESDSFVIFVEDEVLQTTLNLLTEKGFLATNEK